MTLVRVREDRVSDSPTDHRAVKRNGLLWVLVRTVDSGDRDLRIYRSLATGERHLWYDSEVEHAEEDNNGRL
jgi:hypothetical protein